MHFCHPTAGPELETLLDYICVGQRINSTLGLEDGILGLEDSTLGLEDSTLGLEDSTLGLIDTPHIGLSNWFFLSYLVDAAFA